MKLSVCTDAVFNDMDIIQSMKAVKNIGYNAIEFWSWWDKDIESIIKTKDDIQLNIIAFCTKKVTLVDPALRNTYIQGLRESITIAKRLNCKTLITQVGAQISGVPRTFQHNSLVEGLKSCIQILEDADITLVIEPLNIVVDHMGYYLSSSVEAFNIIDEVGSSKIKVLFDIYHQQITEGNLISVITENIDKIGHFHAAGNPGRHELNIGEINYKNIFTAIEKTKYKGYLGLEYFPIEDTITGLEELHKIMPN